MADNQSSPGSHMNMFNKGMTRDTNESFVGDGLYLHARNAVNNSHDGQLGVIGNEPSTFKCVTLPYTLIGVIHQGDDRWILFLTDDGNNSEIGIFDESECSYTKIVNDPCLNFKTTHLITGVSRTRYDCDRLVYWDDGLNPTRFMNIDTPPYVQNCTTVSGCTTCVDTDVLDCEKLRLAPLYRHPCVTIRKGNISGSLANGSYQACVAYTVNQVRITDYMSLTEAQGLFTHENTNSSLEVAVSNIDAGFDEFELVVIFNVNAQTVAKRIGFYDSSQGTIFIDRIDNTSVTVPLSEVVLRAEPIEKTDAMYSVTDYLIRVGVYSKFKFNYQPLANQIRTQWATVQYPANYYAQGNNKTGYMRDEQYAFFIRFIYNTGEYSESYHIPGRPPGSSDRNIIIGGDDVWDGPKEYWQVYNTATVTDLTQYNLPDGGRVIAKGDMGFWESTERYPSNRPDIWNSNPTLPGDPYNLCGKNIRHHKMPDESVDPILSTFNSTGKNIVLLGVEFSNIQFPVDQNGNPITSIVGYQILRGTREGNKSIIAKGLINNMMQYDIPTSGGITRKGLYQNYPYNDLGQDEYLTSYNPTGRQGPGTNGTVDPPNPLALGPRKDIFTFHSPETTFSNPFLSIDELTLYQQRKGKAYGSFIIPYRHPKFKILTDFSYATANTVAIAITALQVAGAIYGVFPQIGIGATEDIPYNNNFLNSWSGSLVAAGPIPGVLESIFDPFSYGEYTIAKAGAAVAAGIMGVIALPATTEQIVKIITGLSPKIQYAAQYVSQGFYSEHDLPIANNQRRQILNINYIDDNIQQFTLDTTTSTAFTINNLNRGKTVALRVNKDVLNCTPLPGYSTGDDSRFILSDLGNNYALNNEYETRISSHYAGLKIQIPSQYGQLDSIRQLIISSCYSEVFSSKTDVLFGGDIYINRFTEKNTMFFFSDWLMGQPDLFDYNYMAYPNIPFPRFWVNTTPNNSFFSLASKYRCLDARDSSTFYIKEGYFYLFNSGVRDFFVESEVNVAYRDWEDTVEKRHYDPNAFVDLTLMFRSDYIRAGNYYKYDYPLSVSKMFGSNISWGNLLPKDYDPEVYSTCYTYRPDRVIYSRPQSDESKKDYWRIFLVNNYRDFPSTVTSIKSVNKNGALFMMRFQSPLQFLGVDQLETDTGTKVTLGDGGLFDQPFQSLVNTDDSYEYGSNQGRYSAVNTSNGLFWISQNQGKIFQYAGGLNDITTTGGMKWWFFKYLPSYLLKQFPQYALYDNPVVGVGAQTLYDNINDILYITKRDFRPKVDLWLDPSNNRDFYTDSTKSAPAPFTNTDFWEPAHFTVSYDPKLKMWISFHDWIPSFFIPSKTFFMSVGKESSSTKDTVWKHNLRCDSYCNFYGVDYPFEIAFTATSGQQVNSMRNIEYLLEVYNYYNDCRDKFHVLDQNFDQAVIYNSEQVSGILELSLKSKTNPLDSLIYPQIGSSSIKIQFSKEENKYRFNQFWDITKDRGEFSNVSLPMFVTEPNGYKFQINPAYVDYGKAALQRKKFRHYVNNVFLKKHVSGKNKFLFKIVNEKLLQSPR